MSCIVQLKEFLYEINECKKTNLMLKQGRGTRLTNTYGQYTLVIIKLLCWAQVLAISNLLHFIRKTNFINVD